MVRVREEILLPLRRTLRWLLGRADASAPGRLLCEEHGVEHTGKSACALGLASELLRIDPGRDAALLQGAVRDLARRVAGRLEREGDSACFTFRPGRHDPFNCSNHVIDGGACSDALAEVVRTHGAVLPSAERESAQQASLVHARTYLRYAVLDKGIPAQRAWGLTGLASACALSREPELERAALEAVGMLEAIQHDDGSYPYHPPEWSDGAVHPGASDVSAFYQSRVTGFVSFALERLGRDPAAELFRRPLFRGLEFLLALQGPDGVKAGLVEAKPWYWGAEYEVASHPFDAHALATGMRLFGRERHGEAALAAFRAWAAHLAPDGRPRDHLPGAGRSRSYQCPFFWAAHAWWMARAAEDLERAAATLGFEPRAPASAPASATGDALDLYVTWFGAAQLARLEDARVVAWVRGARPAFNVHHGSPHGAGLVRAVEKRTGAELVARPRGARRPEAEWSGARGLPSPARGWRSGADELRFSLWLARVHARAGRHAAALAQPWRTFRDGVLAPAAPRVSSAWFTAPEVEPAADGVTLTSGLAFADGTPVPGARIERRFALTGDGLDVRERVLDAGGARGLDYAVPRAAHDLERGPREVAYRLG